MNSKFLVRASLLAAVFCSPALALADVVTTGKVIRGVTLPGPAGAPGTSAGATCDFNGEPVSQANRLEGASVNCRAGESRAAQVLVGLPQRFNAYCVSNAPPKSARLITSSMTGNANHCDLSGITIKDATQQFGGAVWR